MCPQVEVRSKDPRKKIETIDHCFFVDSQPGDVTHYEYYVAYHAGAFFFVNSRNTFRYPYCIARETIEGIDWPDGLVDINAAPEELKACLDRLAQEWEVNPFTLGECIRTAKEILAAIVAVEEVGGAGGATGVRKVAKTGEDGSATAMSRKGSISETKLDDLAHSVSDVLDEHFKDPFGGVVDRSWVNDKLTEMLGELGIEVTP